MSLPREDYLKLKNYCQEVISKPRPIDDQPHERSGIHIWCEDWKIIEILKYLFIGPETYVAEAPPKRLKNNPLWSKDDIIHEAETIKSNCETTEKIIEHLRYMRSENASRV